MFTKTKPWIVASLMAATSVFADNNDNCRTTPTPPEPNQAPLTAAYNAPARIDVRACWDLAIEASFIYWQPLQDNMEIGINTSSAADPRVLSGATNNTINFSSDYQPGFQVGLGMNLDWDNWDSFLEYTWFHNSQTTSSTGTGFASIFPVQGDPVTDDAGQTNDTMSGKWTLKMDLADWQLARAHYVGTRLTYRPYFGIRAAWIREKYNLTGVNTGVVGTAATSTVHNSFTSWGVGPQVGFSTNYLIGYGFRCFGDVEADLLYTRYRTSFRTTGLTAVNVSQTGLYTIRPHTNMDFGFAWGSYFDNNNWHFDLLASYGFQVFWNQNMFRHFTDDAMPGNSNLPNGNLYVHGLNLTLRLDF